MKIQKKALPALIVVSIVSTAAVMADTLEFKNGRVLEGNYQGGTAQTIRFQSGAETKAYERSDIVALTLTPPKSGAGAAITGPAAAAGASQPAPAATIPAGTRLQVRMVDGVDSSKDQAGKRFAGKLEAALVVNGATVAPVGTTVHGQLVQAEQAGRIAGQSVLSLALTDILINGQATPLMTSSVTLAGQAEGRQTARRAAGGAIIGGMAGNAGAGAAVGAGTAGIRPGEAVGVAPGSLVEFSLSQPLTVQSR